MSGFSSLHSLPSAAQYRVPFFKSRSTSSHTHFAGTSLVAQISHQCEFIIMACHLVNSPQVTDRSCDSLLALTTTLLPILVDNIHSISHLTSADFPTPRPLETASRSVDMSTSPRLSLMCLAIVLNTSRCQVRGPLNLASGVLGWPHGNANSTNASGSSATRGSHSRDMRSCSSSELYIGSCIIGCLRRCLQ